MRYFHITKYYDEDTPYPTTTTESDVTFLSFSRNSQDELLIIFTDYSEKIREDLAENFRITK